MTNVPAPAAQAPVQPQATSPQAPPKDVLGGPKWAGWQVTNMGVAAQATKQVLRGQGQPPLTLMVVKEDPMNLSVYAEILEAGTNKQLAAQTGFTSMENARDWADQAALKFTQGPQLGNQVRAAVPGPGGQVAGAVADAGAAVAQRVGQALGVKAAGGEIAKYNGGFGDLDRAIKEYKFQLAAHEAGQYPGGQAAHGKDKSAITHGLKRAEARLRQIVADRIEDGSPEVEGVLAEVGLDKAAGDELAKAGPSKTHPTGKPRGAGWVEDAANRASQVQSSRATFDDAPKPGDYIGLPDGESHATVREFQYLLGSNYDVIDDDGEEWQVKRDPANDNQQRRAFKVVQGLPKESAVTADMQKLDDLKYAYQSEPNSFQRAGKLADYIAALEPLAGVVPMQKAGNRYSGRYKDSAGNVQHPHDPHANDPEWQKDHPTGWQRGDGDSFHRTYEFGVGTVSPVDDGWLAICTGGEGRPESKILPTDGEAKQFCDDHFDDLDEFADQHHLREAAGAGMRKANEVARQMDRVKACASKGDWPGCRRVLGTLQNMPERRSLGLERLVEAVKAQDAEAVNSFVDSFQWSDASIAESENERVRSGLEDELDADLAAGDSLGKSAKPKLGEDVLQRIMNMTPDDLDNGIDIGIPGGKVWSRVFHPRYGLMVDWGPHDNEKKRIPITDIAEVPEDYGDMPTYNDPMAHWRGKAAGPDFSQFVNPLLAQFLAKDGGVHGGYYSFESDDPHESGYGKPSNTLTVHLEAAEPDALKAVAKAKGVAMRVIQAAEQSGGRWDTVRLTGPRQAVLDILHSEFNLSDDDIVDLLGDRDTGKAAGSTLRKDGDAWHDKSNGKNNLDREIASGKWTQAESDLANDATAPRADRERAFKNREVTQTAMNTRSGNDKTVKENIDELIASGANAIERGAGNKTYLTGPDMRWRLNSEADRQYAAVALERAKGK